MERSKNRVRLYKIISGAVVAILLIKLVALAYDLYHQPGSDAYNLNNAINDSNSVFAQGNKFEFTDKERTTAKPPGVFRIAVLGDSYIWGDGLPYEKVWSHKLEKKILAKYDSVEVLHWGKCGWSTLDEFNFFKEHGKDFGIDLLIIGWVENDPDLGKWPMVSQMDASSRYPTLYKISPWLAQRWVNSDEEDLDHVWNVNIYTPENLKEYQKVLTDFRNYLSGQKLKVLLVMTRPCISEPA